MLDGAALLLDGFRSVEILDVIGLPLEGILEELDGRLRRLRVVPHLLVTKVAISLIKMTTQKVSYSYIMKI